MIKENNDFVTLDSSPHPKKSHIESKKIDRKSSSFRQKARKKLESILNLRTFLIFILIAFILGVYIYNVTSIKQLGEELREKKEILEQKRSIVAEKEAKLKQLQRSDNISTTAYEQLNLQFRKKTPIYIKK